jgi:hypothetical protein
VFRCLVGALEVTVWAWAVGLIRTVTAIVDAVTMSMPLDTLAAVRAAEVVIGTRPMIYKKFRYFKLHSTF